MKSKKTLDSVPCPNCGNKRLFDIKIDGKGVVQIKCPRCRVICNIEISENSNRLMTYCDEFNKIIS